jgi:hypothetical protein
MRLGKKERAVLRLDTANRAVAEAKAARDLRNIRCEGKPKLACHKVAPSSGNARRAATAWPNRWGFSKGVKKHSEVRKVFA